MEALRYCVLLKGALGDPAALARALAPVRGCPEVDLVGPMRRCWGLVAVDIEEGQARREESALLAASIAAAAIPANLVEELPAVEQVRSLRLDLAPVKLLAAAAFVERRSRVVREEEGPGSGKRALQIGLSLATGMPVGLFGGGKKVVEKTISSSDLLYYLDLYVGQPPRRLRVAAHAFDFSCLGQRKGYDAPGNFKRLLQAFEERAAGLNAGARGLLEGRPVRQMGYESLKDLEREARWLLTLAALKP
ncbi:MAG: hypothetical protein KGJ45_01325 [Elusimicrobia bacterium]|nr:hypothetical protein [Elusimicrobiota bacterium]